MENRNYSIVIADDDHDDQFFLKEAIGKSHIKPNLISVFNGSELMDLLNNRGAYASISTKKPDLVLLDLNMPMMDGFDALAQIKKDNQLKDIPVYIITTSRRDNDKQTCIQLGADGFYTKPSEFAKLQDYVSDVLSKTFNNRGQA